MSEKTFSAGIKKQLRSAGFFVIDLESLGDGIPDCLVIDKTGEECAFLEFKKPKGEKTIYQNAWIKINVSNSYSKGLRAFLLLQGKPFHECTDLRRHVVYIIAGDSAIITFFEKVFREGLK